MAVSAKYEFEYAVLELVIAVSVIRILDYECFEAIEKLINFFQETFSLKKMLSEASNFKELCVSKLRYVNNFCILCSFTIMRTRTGKVKKFH